jgi:hypothetical protein
MQVQQTTSCGRHGHPEFRISYDPALVPVEDDVRWFLRWLEEAVAGGERFADGETCQVGWMVIQVRANPDGSLSLWEPDMRQVPVVRVESVSRTLAHLRLQKDVCESVVMPEEMSFPSAAQTALVCTRLGRTDGIVMDRREPSGAISGWFCGCDDKGHDHQDAGELRKVSLYEAAVRYEPGIIPYLALPAGILLRAGQGPPTIFRRGELLAFKPGSYLDVRFRNR